MLLVSVVCARLGVWQLHRYDESNAISEERQSAWHAPPLTELDPAMPLSYRRAELSGRWLEGEPALTTGGLVGGQPGYQVIVLLQTAAGHRLLVDRGWVPVSVTRAQLDELHQPGAAEVSGVLLPIEGDPRGAPVVRDGLSRWALETDLYLGLLPRVLGPPYAAIAAHADPPVLPYVLVLGPELEEARSRQMGPLPVTGYQLPLPRVHHLSYAAQWFGFAGAAVLIWLWASRVRSVDPPSRRPDADR
jgi:surfeit locus 1 family protein